MRYLDTIYGGSVAQHASFYAQAQTIDTDARLLSQFLYADPLLLIFTSYNRRLTVYRTYVRSVDKPKRILSVCGRNPYIKGLIILRDLLRKRSRKASRDAFPSWNRRRALSVYGQTQYTVKDTHTVANHVGTSLALPVGYSATKVELTYYLDKPGLTGRSHCSFDDRAALARRTLPYVGMLFKRTTNLNRYGQHILSSLSISEDQISYTLKDVFWQGYPTKRTMKCGSLTIIYQRANDNHVGFDVSIEIVGLKTMVIDNDPNQTKPSWNPFSQGIVVISQNSDDLSKTRDNALAACHSVLSQHMTDFRPALYFTQGKALNAILADYSRNFENFVESPELFELLSSISTLDDGGWLKSFKNSSFYWRLNALVLLISGAYLLWNFALKPTQDAVVKLAKATLQPLRGEGSMSFSGEDYTQLPQGLWTLLFEAPLNRIGLTKTDVIHYDISFRSTATSTPDYSCLVRATMDSYPILWSGILPSPKQIWAIQGGSFIVDWVLPIGGYIDAHEAYLKSPTMPFRIGHTVSISFTVKDGRTFEGFWRSSESNFPTDPPGDAWLVAPGVPFISIPLALSTLLVNKP